MSLLKSVTTFGGFTLLSRLTGFMRDIVLANFLGAGLASDAFFVSFKLPNLFRSLFAEGAFTSAFVPMFSQKLVSDGKKKAVFFASETISLLSFILFFFVLGFELFMPYIVQILAPGFIGDAGKIELATTLCRITFPFLLFISVVSFQAGVLQSFEKFAAPASAPIILNLTLVLSAFTIAPLMPISAYGFATAVTLAGILEILWLRYALHKIDVKISPHRHFLKIFQNPDIKVLFKRIVPGIVGAGIYQINMALDTILVSLVGTGAISWLYYANRLQQLPLGVVGAAISVALLPILSKQLKAGNLEEGKKTEDKAVEYAVMLSMPFAVLMIVLAIPAVNVLFEHGRFSSEDTVKTAYALVAYAIGLPCYVVVKALMPNFFARGDTVTPVKYSAVVFAVNLVFNLVLMFPFGHVGIATATTIASFVSLFQYIYGLHRKDLWHFSKHLLYKILRITAASVLSGVIVYFADYVFSEFDIWQQGILIRFLILAGLGSLGLASYVILIIFFKVISLSEIRGLLLKKKGGLS